VSPLSPLEERRYRRDAMESHLRQIWIADPDGYVLRFASQIDPSNSDSAPLSVY
jgi:hypothetical protein